MAGGNDLKASDHAQWRGGDVDHTRVICANAARRGAEGALEAPYAGHGPQNHANDALAASRLNRTDQAAEAVVKRKRHEGSGRLQHADNQLVAIGGHVVRWKRLDLPVALDAQR